MIPASVSMTIRHFMKKIITLLTLLLFYAVPGKATNTTMDQGGTRQKKYFSVVRYEPHFNKILIPVRIKDKTYRFMLDTGAPTTISQTIYDELKPAVLEKAEVVDQSGKRDSMFVVSLKEIMVGDVLFEDIPALTAGPGPVFDCFGIDGIIGSNLLRTSIVRLSAADSTITLTDDLSRLSLSKRSSVPLKLSPGQSSPYVEITLKGARTASEYALFDTGADTFYDLTIGHFNQFRPYNIFSDVEHGHGSNTMGINGMADTTLLYRLRVPALIINGVTFRNTTTQTTNSSNSRIGHSILDHGIVTVDYKHKRFYFEAFKADNDLQEKLPGISPSFINNKYCVGIVWDEQLREKISPGDQIVSLDGVSYEHISLCDLLTRESVFKHKTKVAVVLRNKDGQLATEQLTKE